MSRTMNNLAILRIYKVGSPMVRIKAIEGDDCIRMVRREYRAQDTSSFQTLSIKFTFEPWYIISVWFH
jgi:hypothetical protein